MAKKQNKNGRQSIGKASPGSQLGRLFQQARQYHAQGHLYEAEQGYKSVLAMDSAYAPALIQLSRLAMEAGRYPIALEYGKRAVQADQANAQAHLMLGSVLSKLGLVELAESELMVAQQLAPDDDWIDNALGLVLAQKGETEEALALFRKAIEIDPRNVVSYYNLSTNKRLSGDDPDFALIQGMAKKLDLSEPETEAVMHFTLAKALQDSGSLDEAFDHFQQGNQIKQRRSTFRIEDQERLTDCLIEVQNEAWLDGVAYARDSEGGNIFIVGMPRSGTTLLESVLSRHPQVTGIGETPYINNLARASEQVVGKSDTSYPFSLGELKAEQCKGLGDQFIALSRQFGVDTPFVVDKTPGNFMHLGFILAILPDAKIVHSMRDPVDTCLSIYQQYFTGGMSYSYDLENIGRYYLLYRRFMDHWQALFPQRIYHARYEDMVTDTEGELRKLTEFCGLPWDDKCLAAPDDNYQIRTGSIWQARQPVYRSSMQRWRKYEKHLGPLLEVLAPVLEAGE